MPPCRLAVVSRARMPSCRGVPCCAVPHHRAPAVAPCCRMAPHFVAKPYHRNAVPPRHEAAAPPPCHEAAVPPQPPRRTVVVQTCGRAAVAPCHHTAASPCGRCFVPSRRSCCRAAVPSCRRCLRASVLPDCLVPGAWLPGFLVPGCLAAELPYRLAAVLPGCRAPVSSCQRPTLASSMASSRARCAAMSDRVLTSLRTLTDVGALRARCASAARAWKLVAARCEIDGRPMGEHRGRVARATGLSVGRRRWCLYRPVRTIAGSADGSAGGAGAGGAAVWLLTFPPCCRHAAEPLSRLNADPPSHRADLSSSRRAAVSHCRYAASPPSRRRQSSRRRCVSVLRVLQITGGQASVLPCFRAAWQTYII